MKIVLWRNKQVENRINTLTNEIKQLQANLNKLELELEKVKFYIQELQHKYNSIRASLASRSRYSKLERIAQIDPKLLEELGYEVITVRKKQEQEQEEE